MSIYMIAWLHSLDFGEWIVIEYLVQFIHTHHINEMQLTGRQVLKKTGAIAILKQSEPFGLVYLPKLRMIATIQIDDSRTQLFVCGFHCHENLMKERIA